MGLPCVFVRLTECDLRCTYCDTEYAFYEGEERTVQSIIEQVSAYGCNLVEITGGEPLLQPEVYDLMTRLCDLGFSVMLETSGHILVDKVDKRVKKIIDMKTPHQGCSKRMTTAILRLHCRQMRLSLLLALGSIMTGQSA